MQRLINDLHGADVAIVLLMPVRMTSIDNHRIKTALLVRIYPQLCQIGVQHLGALVDGGGQAASDRASDVLMLIALVYLHFSRRFAKNKKKRDEMNEKCLA